MSSKLPVISGKDAVKAFTRSGYVIIRRRGSHIRMKHASESGRKKLTIPDHRILGRGLLRKLIRDAEITIDEFNKLLEK